MTCCSGAFPFFMMLPSAENKPCRYAILRSFAALCTEVGTSLDVAVPCLKPYVRSR